MRVPFTTIRSTQVAKGLETAMTFDLIASIRKTHGLLIQQRELSLDDRTLNAAVEQLMDQLRQHYEPDQLEAVMSDPYVQTHLPDLQWRMGKYEYLTELAAAQHLSAQSEMGMSTLQAMPQWLIYEHLVQGELDALKRCTAKAGIQAAVFVGSGPLPLSAIMLHQLSAMPVTCLEYEPHAYETSRALLSRLHLTSSIRIELIDGAHYNYKCGTLVFVASLVANKRAVLSQIRRMAPDAWIAVRTAEGVKQLMYEQLDESELRNQGWYIQARTEPDRRRVINSTWLLHR